MSTIKINPWFGQVPNKWQQGQLKRFYSVRLGKMLQPNPLNPNDKLVPYMRAANIAWTGPDISEIKEMWASPDEIINNKLESDDLLISEGGDVGRSCLWNNEIPFCIFQNAINRVRPRYLNSTKFLYYLVQAAKNSGWIDIVCNKATIAHFTAEKVNALEIPIPNYTQQRRIAAYLDEQTAKIDRLINLRQRQIALLKEQRAALIQQAVTRGLNPDVPMKDSGLPWLGEIPAHWEVKPVKYVARILRGRFGHRPRTDPTLYDGAYPFIQTGDVANANKYLSSYKQTLTDKGLGVSVEFPAGTLLMAIAANIGDLAILGISACLPDSIVGFFPYHNINIELLYYQLSCLKKRFHSLAPENTQMNLNIDRISPEKILFPPQEEQGYICQYINECENKIESTITAYSRQITLLTEYRAALIHECVTGQRVIPDYFNTGG